MKQYYFSLEIVRNNGLYVKTANSLRSVSASRQKNENIIYLTPQIGELNMQNRKPKVPEGSSVVSPYMILNSVEEQLEFFKKVFDAEVKDSVKQSDGLIMHAEIRIGDSSIMMGRANENFPSNQSMVYVYVDDADAAYKKAIEYGAKSLMEPEDRFYGNREGGVMDTQGNTWWIAQFIKDVSAGEIEKFISEAEKK
jgi:PhnB protein